MAIQQHKINKFKHGFRLKSNCFIDKKKGRGKSFATGVWGVQPQRAAAGVAGESGQDPKPGDGSPAAADPF